MDNSIYGAHLPELEAVRQHLLGEVETIRRDMERETGFDPVEHCLSRIKSEESMREKCRRRGLPETTESALTQLYDAVGIRVICAFLQDVYAIRDRLAALPDIEIVAEKDYIRRAKPNGYRSLHLILRVKGVHTEHSAGMKGLNRILAADDPNRISERDGSSRISGAEGSGRISEEEGLIPAADGMDFIPAAEGGAAAETAAGDGVYAEIQLRTISQDTWAALEHQMRYKKDIGGNTALIGEELKRCADELASTDVSMQTIRDMIWNSKEGS